MLLFDVMNNSDFFILWVVYIFFGVNKLLGVEFIIFVVDLVFFGILLSWLFFEKCVLIWFDVFWC